MNDKRLSSTSCPAIKKKEDGTFLIDCVKTVQGKWVHIYSSGYFTLEEAVERLPRLLAEKAHARRGKDMTLEAFLRDYESYRLLHVRPSTVAFGKSVAKTFLSPYSERVVKDVFSYHNLSQIYETILNQRGTPAWKNRCIGTLRHMVLTASKWKLINAEAYQDGLSILENIPEHRGKRNLRPIWTKREKERFLSAIEDEEDKLIFELFLALGARIGEFTGLTWDCFDARRGVMVIKQQLVYQNVGKWVLSSELKTRESYRECKLPSRIVDMLKEYKAHTSGKGFLFRSKENPDNPLSKATLRRKLFHYIEVAGVPRITPHCLRHARATDLLRVCRDMEEVKAAARYLGHSATMMIDTYGHSAQEATNAVLRRLEKLEQG